MKRVADILVKYRIIFFSVSVILALLCGLMIPFVTINKDQSKYLAKDSNMSQGLEIINKEFPDPGLKDNFQIMFEGLTPSEKQIIYEELAGFDGVTSVEYDGESSKYNTKTFTMYTVHTEFVNDSDNVGKIITAMKNAYSDRYPVESYYSGGYLDVLDKLIPMALLVGLIVLLIMCRSYFEPVLLLVSIGVAVLINMGTNVIFESVSDMTFSIAAVFQLVLSIDYSIMLLHRYQQELEIHGTDNRKNAMSEAIVNAFGSIMSSSTTTIVGLLVLLLMTFTIGKDIGLVISKGVFFSLVCVFTVMPALILWFDNLIFKLDKDNIKKQLKSRMEVAEND